jgi:RND family efflux transporter MFP subunit
MRLILWGMAVLVVALLGFLTFSRFQSEMQPAAKRSARVPPAVAVSSIRQEPIERWRSFSGSLESPNAFMVAPRLSGRIVKVTVDTGDVVKSGQVVAELEDVTFKLEVQAAEAELQLAEARLYAAQNNLKIAERKLSRAQKLKDNGFESEAALDEASAEQLRFQADVRIAEAQIARNQADLAEAKARLDDLQVFAVWQGESGIVAGRYSNEGDNVAANEAIMSIVDVNPLRAVVFVTERDYGFLEVGQEARLRTDAYADRDFPARIARISPVFNTESRQARVELEVANGEGELAPGMFARIDILLERVEHANVAPLAAIVRRDDVDGIFLLKPDQRVVWQPVKTGIRQGERVQLLDESLSGEVVTLGHQMISDGVEVTIPSALAREARL